MKQNINISLKAMKKWFWEPEKLKGFYWIFKQYTDVYKNIEECNSDRESIELLVSDD